MKFHCPEHGDYEKQDVQVAYIDGGIFCPMPVHHGIAMAFEEGRRDRFMNEIARYMGRPE